jgi:SEC-C motif
MRRGDPCWCGSGRKFKRCHMQRQHENSLPVAAINSRLISGRRLEVCWHPQASKSTCGKIVRAHSLQRSTTLRAIMDERSHVLTFCPPRHDYLGRPIPNEVGWKEASTFRGFCGIHDNELFAPVETRPFVATPEQCFLLAYRAACHEVHQKQAMWDLGPDMQGLLDRGASPTEQQAIQAEFRTMLGGTGWALIRLNRFKERMDASLRVGSFDAWQFGVVDLVGVPDVLSTGLVEPNVDFQGRVLQSDMLTHSECLAYATVIRDGGVSIVLAWLKENLAPRTFWDSLTTLPAAEAPQVLTQFMFAYVENTFFSRKWWDSRRMFVRDHITALALSKHPYMEPPRFEPKHVTSLVVERLKLL